MLFFKFFSIKFFFFINKLVILLVVFKIKKYFFSLPRYYKLAEGKKYINKCLQSVENKKIFKIKNQKPYVSIVIPVFNCENSIKLSIASIQYQRLKEIEIILVNDYSKDNSLNIIENIQKDDQRIVIINNNKNRGTLYSRNIGAMYANGKYIFCLDNDDMFLSDNIIFKIYKTCLRYDYDILGFNIINAYNYNSEIKNMYDNPFITQKKDQIVYQPKLKYFSIKNNDVHIWGKCIKNEVYKKAISLLGIKRSTSYLCNAEDDVIVLMIFNAAKNYRFTPIYGILHLVSNRTATFYLPRNHMLFGRLFFLDLLFDSTGNNSVEKKYVIDNAIIMKQYIISNNITFNKKNTDYLKIIMKKIFSCPNISQKNKTHLKNIFFNLNLCLLIS